MTSFPAIHKKVSVHRILLMYPTILNEFFVQRTEAWFRIVIQEGLGFRHYWYRFEFAKSRGAIHFHSLLFDTDKSRLLHGCLDNLRQLFPDFLQDTIDFTSQAPSLSDLNDAEQELVHELVQVLPRVLAPMTTLHPAGRTLQPLPGHNAPPTDAQGSFDWSPWAKARLAAAGVLVSQLSTPRLAPNWLQALMYLALISETSFFGHPTKA